MKQDNTANVVIRFVGLLFFLVVFPLIWFGGAYLLSQGNSPFLTLSESGREVFTCVGVILWIFFIFVSFPNSEDSSSSSEETDDEEERTSQEVSTSVDVLLETEKHEGKIFTFSANFTKVPAVDDVLVVYSDNEDDYVEFLVSDVHMATNLPGGESYLVKGQVIGLGQEKLSEYGWEEK